MILELMKTDGRETHFREISYSVFTHQRGFKAERPKTSTIIR
jgi:hypothetical protein